MEKQTFALRGNVVYSAQKDELTSLEGGYLVCEDGVCRGAFLQLPEQYAGIPVTDWGNRLIIPGLVDLHVHAPQYAFRGLGMDMELLPWLQTYAFPEEARYQNLEYARAAYMAFASALAGSATTRAAVFGTIHVPATLLLMELLEAAGLVAYVGKVNMDRNSTDNLTETAEASLQDTRRWLRETAGRHDSVRPILTPRFVPSCSDELMHGLGALQREYGVPVQSHLSENRDEIAWVKELCPSSTCYGGAYAAHGLFGGGVPTVMAHCVHSQGEELELLRKNGVFVAHCPQSNMNLASGVAPVRAFLSHGVNVGLGSDVAGGCDLSIFVAMRDAVRASKLRYAMQDRALAPITAAEAFYMGTKGGGAFFGKVGSFEPGYEFDAVVVNDEQYRNPHDSMTLAQRLERVIYFACDHVVEGKYIAGRRVK